jgi:hypothetical protein
MKYVRMKLLVCAVVFAIISGSLANAAEITFNPAFQGYNMESTGKLCLWGVPEAEAGALTADPNNGWPSEMAIAAWYITLLRAQARAQVVTVGYDPGTFDIWYVSKPH